MSNTDDEVGWSLTDDDRHVLDRIGSELRMAASLAQRGHDLIGLGEAWDAIERILEGQSVEVMVSVSVGIRRGDREFREGKFACLQINEEEIVLDELNT